MPTVTNGTNGDRFADAVPATVIKRPKRRTSSPEGPSAGYQTAQTEHDYAKGSYRPLPDGTNGRWRATGTVSKRGIGRPPDHRMTVKARSHDSRTRFARIMASPEYGSGLVRETAEKHPLRGTSRA